MTMEINLPKTIKSESMFMQFSKASVSRVIIERTLNL